MSLMVNNNLLEVGPGKGALTKYFVEKPNLNFKAVEADWDMVHYLQQNYELDESQLIQQDFLKLHTAQPRLFRGETQNVQCSFQNMPCSIAFLPHGANCGMECG